MTIDREVLDRAEAWYDSWHLDSEAASAAYQDLYQAVSARRSEQGPWLTTMPGGMWHDIQAQLDAEAWESARRGEHIIKGDFWLGRVDANGDRVLDPALYLDSKQP